MKRNAAVAGQFYPGQKKSLISMISNMVTSDKEKKKSICIISPHAGYIYSGKVAAEVFSTSYLPDCFVILGPNHTGFGSFFSVMTDGIWETPLGQIQINRELSELIMKNCEFAEDDIVAHKWEHSIEVQLPFIQYFKTDFSIVPICIQMNSYEKLNEFGKNLAKAIKLFNRESLIIASTDMSHYVTQKIAEKKDHMAVEKIINLDPKGLYETVKKENISMCGIAPVTVALSTSIELGANFAELVKYATSGEVSGDFDQVVGYAGIRISKG
ncbi:MAG: AmmeMemoRadiSam system protein B [Acidobacteriota bacterium]